MLTCTGVQASVSGDGTATGAAEGNKIVFPRGKILLGHHDDTAYGHGWQTGGEGKSDVYAVTGSYPSMISWDLGGIELGDSSNLDGVPFSLIRREAAAQHYRGGVNTFSWHLRNPIDGRDSWQTDSTIVRAMVSTPEGKAAYTRQLELAADFFLSLTDSTGQRIPVIFRPWHELTGGWFFWGQKHCSKEEYQKLWGEMRKVFDARGVDNITWAWSPDITATYEEFIDRYPGDDHVDIIGCDVYHFNGPQGTDKYVESADRMLGFVNRAAKEHGKIAAFTETGIESVPIPDWYTRVLLPLLRKHKPAYVVLWRNAHDKPNHYYAPYPGHPAADDFRQFVKDPLMIMNGIRNEK